jgi:hypothetical protein
MKSITNTVRSDEAFAILHLFEFDMYNLDNTFKETLRFTDHDIFVFDGTNEYTPLVITFDRLAEDFTMQSDSISISIDNINGNLSSEALASEWRNNRCKVDRVIYTPPSETIGSDSYEFGVSDNGSTTYPRLEINTLDKDQYTPFEGVVDTFSATTQALQATLTTQFAHWAKPYPPRTYNQNEFTSIVDAIVDVIYWGRQKTV